MIIFLFMVWILTESGVNERRALLKSANIWDTFIFFFVDAVLVTAQVKGCKKALFIYSDDAQARHINANVLQTHLELFFSSSDQFLSVQIRLCRFAVRWRSWSIILLMFWRSDIFIQLTFVSATKQIYQLFLSARLLFWLQRRAVDFLQILTGCPAQ